VEGFHDRNYMSCAMRSMVCGASVARARCFLHGAAYLAKPQRECVEGKKAMYQKRGKPAGSARSLVDAGPPNLQRRHVVQARR
jgi:hypothetical protein